jgi:argininosuccinate lyase
VENVNQKVMEGMPFRDAYRAIGGEIEAGTYTPIKELHHTLEGSIGNLCNEEINEMMNETLKSFKFEKVHEAFEKLLNYEVE